MSRVSHNYYFGDESLLTLALESKDMCHDNIDALVIP